MFLSLCSSRQCFFQAMQNSKIFCKISNVTSKRVRFHCTKANNSWGHGHIWIRVLQGIIFVFIANLGQISRLQMPQQRRSQALRYTEQLFQKMIIMTTTSTQILIFFFFMLRLSQRRHSQRLLLLMMIFKRQKVSFDNIAVSKASCFLCEFSNFFEISMNKKKNFLQKQSSLSSSKSNLFVGCF